MSGRSAHLVHAEIVNNTAAINTIAALGLKRESLVVPLQLCTKNCHGWTLTVENSWYFIASPAEQESGAGTPVSFVGCRVGRTSSRAGLSPAVVQ
jgi:hypothetical protein